MKKSIIILFLVVVSLAGFSQSKKDTANKLTDSTALLSLKDLNEFDALLKQKFSISELDKYNELFQWMQARVATRIREFEAKSKKP